MLIRHTVLENIRAGRVSIAFRRWKRPTVRAGGTLNTAVGVLRIVALEQIAVASVTEADARAAGYPDRARMLAELDRPGPLWRIALRWEGEAPRVALAATPPDPAEIAAICKRLAAIDVRSPDGPWTEATLRLIAAHPEVRAAELAAQTGQACERLKTRVRRLKALGLTESLGTGYRLSARGHAVLQAQEMAAEGKKDQD